MRPDPRRVAVIGAGHVAQQHLACLSSMPGVRLVGVCDLSAAAAECAAERHGAGGWYTDHAAMLTALAPEVVHVATPPQSHYAIAGDCLRAGAHVFLEKPATTTLAELQSLLGLADGQGRMLVENYNYLWNAPARRLRESVREGRLGSVRHVEATISLDLLGEGSPFADPNLAHPALALAAGPIEDYLPHLAAFAYDFCGPVEAARSDWGLHAPGRGLRFDEFRALLRCERATAALSFSAHAQPDLFRVSVHGSAGRATVDLFEHRMTRAVARSGPRPLVPFWNALEDAATTAASAFQLVGRKLSGGPGAYEGLWDLVRRFHAALAGGQLPHAPRDVLEVNRIVQALRDGAAGA